MKRKIVQSSLLYTIGNVLLQGLAFFTLPIYTRVISKEVFGQYNVYMAWVGMVSLFIGLQTGGSLSSARVRYRESDYRAYSVTALTVSSLFFVVCGSLILLFNSFFGRLFGLPDSMVLFLLCQSFATYVSSFLGQYFIQQQKTLLNLILSALVSVMNVGLSLVLIFTLEDAFLARVLGQLLPSSLVACATLIYFYSRKEKALDRRYLSFVFLVSLPLIFHHLGHQLLNQLDRIMIGKMTSVEDVALYSFGYNVGLVIQVVLGSINTAWTPWFFEAKKQNKLILPRAIQYYLSAGLFLTLGYLTIFPELARLLGGKVYQESHGAIGMIVVSYFFVFLYTFPVNIQFYKANTRYIPIGTLFAASANFLLNLWLIPQLGVYGAALATVLSYMLLLVFHHLLTKKLYAYKDVSVKQYLYLSAIALGYTLLMSYWIESWFVRWSCGVVVLIVYGWYYKDELIALQKRKK